MLIYLSSIEAYFPSDVTFHYNYAIARAAAGKYKEVRQLPATARPHPHPGSACGGFPSPALESHHLFRQCLTHRTNSFGGAQ